MGAYSDVLEAYPDTQPVTTAIVCPRCGKVEFLGNAHRLGWKTDGAGYVICNECAVQAEKREED